MSAYPNFQRTWPAVHESAPVPLHTAEGGRRIDTHRVCRVDYPACVSNACAGGREPCATPERCRVPSSGASPGRALWIAVVLAAVVLLVWRSQ